MQEKQYTLTLPHSVITVIDRGLQELPFKDSARVIHLINEQIVKTMKAETETKELEVTPAEFKGMME